jgi:hypothetical protein
MIKQGKKGIFCGKEIFSTEVREGISYFNTKISEKEADKIIRSKHQLRPPKKKVEVREYLNKKFPNLYRKIKTIKERIVNIYERS